MQACAYVKYFGCFFLNRSVFNRIIFVFLLQAHDIKIDSNGGKPKVYIFVDKKASQAQQMSLLNGPMKGPQLHNGEASPMTQQMSLCNAQWNGPPT